MSRPVQLRVADEHTRAGTPRGRGVSVRVPVGPGWSSWILRGTDQAACDSSWAVGSLDSERWAKFVESAEPGGAGHFCCRNMGDA